MGDVAIRVEGLSKQYRIGGKQERYKTLRDTLTDAFSSPFRRAAQLVRGQAYGAANLNETIWALKDVSFEVKKGEVVGIIGRNGAGKSTLLKILSRITEPTSGYVEVFGRIGALLEVGTGFHPELTGRENIYLNGAILGMTRQEIDRKFDEIVDFAGVEKFIDTPVKHYSSGMGLRLGFAVAAHLEPEILIVDEVLAVGDLEFQKKCLGKMRQVAGEGRTVLFVSHNMSAITALTEKCILLKAGHVSEIGTTSDIVRTYIANVAAGQFIDWNGDGPGDDTFSFQHCRVGKQGQVEFASNEPLCIVLGFEVKRRILGLRVGFDLVSADGIIVFRSYFNDTDKEVRPIDPGVYEAVCEIPPDLLNAGNYYISLRANIHAVRHIVILEQALSFTVTNIRGVNSSFGSVRPGLINPRLNWKVNRYATT